MAWKIVAFSWTTVFRLFDKQGVNEFVFTVHLWNRMQRCIWQKTRFGVPQTYLEMGSPQKAGEYWCCFHSAALKYPLFACTLIKFFHNSFSTVRFFFISRVQLMRGRIPESLKFLLIILFQERVPITTKFKPKLPAHRLVSLLGS